MDMAFIVALIIAIPSALAITRVVMTIAARHNRAAERWEYYCRPKK
jgi:hypothetical protein